MHCIECTQIERTWMGFVSQQDWALLDLHLLEVIQDMADYTHPTRIQHITCYVSEERSEYSLRWGRDNYGTYRRHREATIDEDWDRHFKGMFKDFIYRYHSCGCISHSVED